jgi:hypothetical protein
MAELDRIEDGDREAAIDVGLLRQIGDLGAPDGTQLDAAGERPQQADDGLQQRRLAGAVGADDGRQRARPEAAAQVMDGGMAVVAEREIIEPDGGGAHDHQSSAQPTAAHSSSMMQRIQANRPSALAPSSVADSRRSTKPILAKGGILLRCERGNQLWYNITLSINANASKRWGWPHVK